MKSCVGLRKVRIATRVPPVRRVNTVTWRKDSVALAPDDSAFARAAEWELTVPALSLRGVSDVFLDISYDGDVARLYSGNRLLDDDFYKGTPWRIGLRRYAAELAEGPLTLRILPLRADAPVYFQAERRPRIAPNGQLVELRAVNASAERELVIRPRRPAR